MLDVELTLCDRFDKHPESAFQKVMVSSSQYIPAQQDETVWSRVRIVH